MATLTAQGYGFDAIEKSSTFARRVANFFAHLRHIARMRRDFTSLSMANERMLADIGLSRQDVANALNTQFWIDPLGYSCR